MWTVFKNCSAMTSSIGFSGIWAEGGSKLQNGYQSHSHMPTSYWRYCLFCGERLDQILRRRCFLHAGSIGQWWYCVCIGLLCVILRLDSRSGRYAFLERQRLPWGRWATLNGVCLLESWRWRGMRRRSLSSGARLPHSVTRGKVQSEECIPCSAQLCASSRGFSLMQHHPNFQNDCHH